MNYNFGAVRIHSGDRASESAKSLNAHAFTFGADVVFGRGKYQPGSASGKKLLAHELTHVVQQSKMSQSAGINRIQRTTITDVLTRFFSPFSKETLWIMPQGDNYTKIVRTWNPVIGAVDRAKSDLSRDCYKWMGFRSTSTSWKPGKTDPPRVDPKAFRIWVSSPPGTDPEACIEALKDSITSLGPTFQLSTGSIGSFGIYATVDSVDCSTKTSTLNIWMYNAMDKDSFGKYAKDPRFALSGMERQYMWWHWKEAYSWGKAAP